MTTVDDLSGQDVFVRKGSIYEESLIRLNEQLKARGKPPAVFVEAPAVLEDDDVLEMVNAGLVTTTIVDDYLAEFWSKVFTNLKVHPDIAVRSAGNLAVAFRKDNPKLREVVNTWIRKHGKGDAFRNTIERRYLDGTRYTKNAAADAERKKFLAVIELFKKYGTQYNLDYLLMAAQGYQESTLDQDVKSPVGAIGVMQVMPPTGKELNVGDITDVESNIHAGVKYMRFMEDQYFANEPMDKMNKALMTFASYNAGPGRIRQLRNEAEKRGLDRNVWFGNVERVGLGADWPRNGHVHEQHLQVLHHLPSHHRSAGAPRGREGGAWEAQWQSASAIGNSDRRVDRRPAKTVAPHERSSPYLYWHRWPAWGGGSIPVDRRRPRARRRRRRSSPRSRTLDQLRVNRPGAWRGFRGASFPWAPPNRPT